MKVFVIINKQSSDIVHGTYIGSEDQVLEHLILEGMDSLEKTRDEITEMVDEIYELVETEVTDVKKKKRKLKSNG